MNYRKQIDYTAIYANLDALMQNPMSQMERYAAIGKAVAVQSEKGAAVAAASYLATQYPNESGFSPRNVRRMRAFYQTYGSNETLLQAAMQLGWTLNVVILEAELTEDERLWYLLAAAKNAWSKSELTQQITDGAFHKAQAVKTAEDKKRDTNSCHAGVLVKIQEKLCQPVKWDARDCMLVSQRGNVSLPNRCFLSGFV